MAQFRFINAFIQQYKETALWACTDDIGRPLDSMYFMDFQWSLDAIARIAKDCDEFITKAEERGILTLTSTFQAEMAGHDFWLTRNRHGAGFWDDPGLYGDENAKALTELSLEFGEVYVFPDTMNQVFHLE